MADFDPEIHTTKRAMEQAMKVERKAREKLEDKFEAMEKAQTDAAATAQMALEAEQAKTKAAEDKATQATQDAAKVAATAVLVSKGVTDPVDQEDILTAHQRRGGDADLATWLGADGAKDRAVARILPDGHGDDDKGTDDKGTDDKGTKEDKSVTGPPNTTAGAKGTGTAGVETKVLDNLGNMRKIEELRTARASYLKEYMGDGYVPPDTSGASPSLAVQAERLAAQRAPKT